MHVLQDIIINLSSLISSIINIQPIKKDYLIFKLLENKWSLINYSYIFDQYTVITLLYAMIVPNESLKLYVTVYLPATAVSTLPLIEIKLVISFPSISAAYIPSCSA